MQMKILNHETSEDSSYVEDVNIEEGIQRCRKNSSLCGRFSCNSCKERSILSVKEDLRLRNIILRGEDEELIKISKCSNSKRVTCGCAKDETHRDWTPLTASLKYVKTGCPTCGIKKRSTSRAVPKDIEESIFAKKEELIKRKIGLLESDATLKGIHANSNTKKVKCECLEDKCHPNWSTIPGKLISGQRGCPACGRLRIAAQKSAPKTFEESLASIEEELASRTKGVEFVRLVNEKDTRTTAEICKQSGRYAEWKCLCCENEWTARIQDVVKETSCPRCSGPGKTERKVVEFLKEICEDVETQYPMGDFRIDARVCYKGFTIDVEVDGDQHYKEGRLFKNTPLKKRIRDDVKKMRMSASEGVPTVRIPIVVVCKDYASGFTKWKTRVKNSMDEATESIKKYTKWNFPIIVSGGYERFYEEHTRLLSDSY
jgi:hypothetical protein